jgi:hypothetical protein
VAFAVLGAGCCPVPDTTPPGPVEAFSATPGDGQAILSWSNPADADFAGVIIRRGEGDYPASPEDGVNVYEGSGETFTDTGLVNGSTYYYAAFAYDEVPNYAEGAPASATPQPNNEGEGEGEGEGGPEGTVEGEGELEGEPTGFVEVPDPLSGDNPKYSLTAPAVPSAGQSVADPDFGLSQRRVVAAERLRHEYSRLDPFNADHSLILLQAIALGEWRVYRTQGVPYDQSGNLVTTLDVEEPRWDPVDPNLLWGIQEFKLVTVSIAQKQATLVKDFAADPALAAIINQNPDLYRVTMKDEGESSVDKRYWAFLIQGMNQDYRARYLFTWDRQQDLVLKVLTLPASGSDIDWVGMSPKGTWVLVGGNDTNTGTFNGLIMANRELTQFHRLDYATAHADVGLDSDGNEVIVMQGVRTDYVDLLPLDTATTPIADAGGSYAGTNRTPLLRLFYDSESPLGLNSGVHISCNYPGYAVVSTYIEPGLPARNWLDRKIVLVKLDRQHPRAFYLAKVYGTRGAYWEETQATISNDGSRIVWATNWNQHVGAERVWCMELTMPEDWSAAH